MIPEKRKLPANFVEKTDKAGRAAGTQVSAIQKRALEVLETLTIDLLR